MVKAVRYEAVPISRQVSVLRWPEASPADFEAFVGVENVNFYSGTIQIRSSSGEWVSLNHNWAVAVADAGDREIMSSEALRKFYRLM